MRARILECERNRETSVKAQIRVKKEYQMSREKLLLYEDGC
jgi:hypothetical protein